MKTRRRSTRSCTRVQWTCALNLAVSLQTERAAHLVVGLTIDSLLSREVVLDERPSRDGDELIAELSLLLFADLCVQSGAAQRVGAKTGTVCQPRLSELRKSCLSAASSVSHLTLNSVCSARMKRFRSSSLRVEVTLRPRKCMPGNARPAEGEAQDVMANEVLSPLPVQVDTSGGVARERQVLFESKQEVGL